MERTFPKPKEIKTDHHSILRTSPQDDLLEKNFEEPTQVFFGLLLQYISGGQIVHRDLVKPPKQCSSDNLVEQEIPLELVNLWNELF